MRRREFITLLGGAAAWPLAARAQQAERMRRIGVLMPIAADNPEAPVRVAAFAAGAGAIGVDRWSQRADRVPLGRRSRAHSQICRGIGRTRTGRHPGLGRLNHGPVATGDPHRADRVRDHRRSGRRRLRREPGAAGRQRHWLLEVRVRHECEMAGTAQRDRAGCDASGGPSGSCHTPRRADSWARSRPWRRRSGWR